MPLHETIQTLISALLFAVSASLTPGPNNFMLMNSGLNYGIKKSLPHYFGICLGFPLMVFLVAYGLGNVFLTYPLFKKVLKIVGSIYMLYLAWQNLAANKATGKPSMIKGKPLSFLSASLFQWFNPKAWVMSISVISMFILSPEPLTNAIYISLLFLGVCLPAVAVWLVFGAYLQKVLKTEKHRKWFNNIMAICLIASIALIYIE